MKSDFTAVGASYRAEAEKAMHRAISFAVILVMSHLLEVRPSEFDGFGFKVAFKDPAILYGTISLLFGYYLSRSLSYSEVGESLYPLHVAPRRMRSNLRLAKRTHLKDKNRKHKKQTPKTLKMSARTYIVMGNILLLPYRTIATLFVLAALIFMATDLYALAVLIIGKSKFFTDVLIPALLH